MRDLFLLMSSSSKMQMHQIFKWEKDEHGTYRGHKWLIKIKGKFNLIKKQGMIIKMTSVFLRTCRSSQSCSPHQLGLAGDTRASQKCCSNWRFGINWQPLNKILCAFQHGHFISRNLIWRKNNGCMQNSFPSLMCDASLSIPENFHTLGI